MILRLHHPSLVRTLLLGICACGALLAACSDDEDTDATTSSSSSGSGASGGATASSGSPGSGGSGATGGEAAAQGGGGTTGEGGSGEGGAGGGTMGIDDACGDCFELQEDCNAAGQTCEEDPQCGPWLGCVEECADDDWSSACIEACDTAFPNAGQLKTNVTTCFCAACANVCAPFCG